MFPNGEGSGDEVIRWEFLDEDEESFLGIEQWSESELGAATGSFVVKGGATLDHRGGGTLDHLAAGRSS